MVTEDRVYDGDGRSDEASNHFADADVVVCARVRVARNIAKFPFVQTCSSQQRSQIQQTLLEHFDQDDHLKQLAVVRVEQLDLLEQQFVAQLERLSRDKPEQSGDSGESTESATMVDQPGCPASGLSVTVNEQDHLRIQYTTDRFNLAEAWETVSRLDDQIDQRVEYAFSDRLGYLTACPADVGTGLRASVLVHLPALAITGQLSKVFRSLQQLNVTAAGAFGTDSPGDFWRLGNRVTLGVDEQFLVEQISEVVPQVIGFERQAREFLVEQDSNDLAEKVKQACQDLIGADREVLLTKPAETTLPWLSMIRLGAGLGLVDQPDLVAVTKVFQGLQLRRLLDDAVSREDYAVASALRDRLRESGEPS